jgi:subtilisin
MLSRVVVTLSMSVAAVLLPGVASAAPSATVSAIVVLQPGADVAADAQALAATHGGRVAQTFTEVLGGFQFVGPAEALTGLRRSSRVRSVVEDSTFELVDSAGWGFFRIDAELSMLDPAGPYRGAGTRVAIIDSGVDLDHPDLASNIDQAAGYNCISPGAPPEDDLGHGTHVAGIAAANFDGAGAAGIAPEARIVPLKAFDASGNGTTAQIICALDRLATVVRSSPAPTVVNMSFADVGTDSVCDDGNTTDVLHEALCDLVDAGESVGSAVVPVAAAGNAATDAASTIPAAFHDVITVSALTDLDGAGGGAAECTFTGSTLSYECDDTLASFSNFGAVVDVAAPGVEIWSTVPGGWDVKSGTSMAAPHVTGVVALMLGENAALDAAGARSLLAQTGECPNGTVPGSDGSCTNQGQWQQTGGFFEIFPDPDGIPEPLVNASRAASAAAAGGDPPPLDLPPTVQLTSPGNGATVSGSVTVAANASDDHGVARVAFAVDGSSIGADTNGTNGWSAPWDTTAVPDGSHDVTATATDTTGQTTTSTVTVSVQNGSVPARTLHIANLIGTTTSGRKWTATVTAVIQDASGAPVDGATVTFDLTNGSGTSASLSARPGGGGGGGGTPTTLTCVTGSTGRCAVSTKPSGTTITFTVRSVEKAGWVRDPGADATTSITLAK